MSDAMFLGTFFSVIIGTQSALLGVACTLVAEKKGKSFSENLFGVFFCAYLVMAFIGAVAMGFSGVWFCLALIVGAYIAASGITMLTAKPRIQSELEFAKKLAALGANLLEEYDLDRDGVISPGDVSRIYRTAPTGSDKQKVAGMLLRRLNQIGHNIAAGGNQRFCVVSAADVAGFVTRVEKLHESWFGPAKTNKDSGQ